LAGDLTWKLSNMNKLISFLRNHRNHQLSSEIELDGKTRALRDHLVLTICDLYRSLFYIQSQLDMENFRLIFLDVKQFFLNIVGVHLQLADADAVKGKFDESFILRGWHAFRKYGPSSGRLFEAYQVLLPIFTDIFGGNLVEKTKLASVGESGPWEKFSILVVDACAKLKENYSDVLAEGERLRLLEPAMV
jgi:hypothetical protein